MHPYGLDDKSSPLHAQSIAIADETAARHAADVDRRARFPEESLRALGAAGLFGLTVPVPNGGLGQGLRPFCAVAEELGRACASSAMVYVMHVSATQAIASSKSLGDRDDILRAIAKGEHLTTLSLSERGSRSQFWAPVSKLSAKGDGFVTNAAKSWVTSASNADSYVSSAQAPDAKSPLESTIYLARTDAAEIRPQGGFDGLGLRGNDSAPLTADGVLVALDAMLGADGAGLDIALSAVLPWFLLLNASASVGLMQSVTTQAIDHLSTTRLEHLDQTLAQQPVSRRALAQLQIETDRTRALVADTLDAVEAGRDDAQLLVLEVKAAADDSAALVADLAMKVCGGAAFRKDLSIERRFRDSRAARVMAPTTDALLDFVGRALTGQPLLDA
jgi:alkylation response protein AidB-like acyl-CoA dehydrogenase